MADNCWRKVHHRSESAKGEGLNATGEVREEPQGTVCEEIFHGWLQSYGKAY